MKIPVTGRPGLAATGGARVYHGDAWAFTGAAWMHLGIALHDLVPATRQTVVSVAAIKAGPAFTSLIAMTAVPQ